MAYIATSDVHSFGGIPATDSVDDAELALVIARAQQFIENYTGRVFSVDSSAETTRYYTATEDVAGLTLYLDDDLNTVVSITAGSDSIASSDYVTEPRNDKPYFGITLKSESPRVWTNATSDGDYENAIAINGQWAYSSDAPADIQHAMLRLVKWFYNQARVSDNTASRPIVLESGAVVMPEGFPEDVMGILKHYRRMNYEAG
jgi:hypothetical protein